MKIKDLLYKPLFEDNPIALQILGICSALAVTSNMINALVMTIAVVVVTAVFFYNSCADIINASHKAQ